MTEFHNALKISPKLDSVLMQLRCDALLDNRQWVAHTLYVGIVQLYQVRGWYMSGQSK